MLWLFAETRLDFRSGVGTGDLIAEDVPLGAREVVMASGAVRLTEVLVEEVEFEARGDEVATTAEAKEGGQTGAGAAEGLVEPGREEVVDERAAAAA